MVNVNGMDMVFSTLTQIVNVQVAEWFATMDHRICGFKSLVYTF